MQKIKDRVMLGILSGFLASIPSRAINTWEYKQGFTETKYDRIAANLFLPKRKAGSRQGEMLGALTNQINTSLTGVLVTYILSKTGRDKAMVKGAGVTSMAWLGIYGLTARAGLFAQSKKPLPHFLSFADHALFGALCGLFSAKLGDDSLFPGAKTRDKREQPRDMDIGLDFQPEEQAEPQYLQ